MTRLRPDGPLDAVRRESELESLALASPVQTHQRGTLERERLLAYIAFVIVCLVWGTTYLAIRIAIETLPTFLFTSTRFILAGSILLLICLARGEKLPVRLSDYLNLLLIGLLMVGGGNVAVVWAEHHVTSGFAALLVATAPFWMAMIEALRPAGNRITRRKGIGMLIGFAGVALLLGPELGLGSAMNRNFLLGVVVLQLGSIAWQLGSVRAKYHPIRATPLVSASLQMLFGGVSLGIIGLLRGEASRYAFNGRTLTAFLYLVIFGSVIAYGAYVYALSKLPTSTVSLYAYVNPVVAVVLGWLILSEPLGWNALVAMIVIFAGVAMVQTTARSSGKPIVVPAPETAGEKI